MGSALSTSVRRRFTFTLGANLLRSALSFVTGMLLARSLGPASYGKMAFLLGTFVAIRQIMDMGSSAAFYTFMSQRPQSVRFVRSFFGWLGFQFLVPLCVVGLLFPSQWIEGVWRGEQRGLIVLAFVAAFMQNSLWPVMQQLGESRRQTHWVQSLGIAIVATHLLAMVLLWSFGGLGLYAIFAAIGLEYVVAAVVMLKWLPNGVPGESKPADAVSRPAFRSFLRYCLPLIPYAWISFAYDFADRWLLQNYGGSVQQAYYAVSAQFAAIALIATSSILNIFWKEIAEAHYNKDHARTHKLYQRISRILFLVGAIVAGFLSPWAERLIRLILGTAYVGGASTLVVMFLYPIHQSMGQIGGTMLYATERVTLQVVIGVVFMMASMGVTYLVLAPADAVVPGLGLASEGLALKMVGLQIIQANIIAYIIARIWKWRFDWVYQPVSLLGCLALGWMAHGAALELAKGSWPVLAVMALGGVLYLMLIAALVYVMPWLAGFTRTEILRDVNLMVRNTITTFKST
jgi:O-antigen/teichoic acid export membrane protein